MLPFICYLDIQLEKQQTETQLSFGVHCKSHLIEIVFSIFHNPPHSFDWHKVLILIAVKVVKMWLIHWIYLTHFHSRQLYVAENVSDNLIFCYVIFHLCCSFK